MVVFVVILFILLALILRFLLGVEARSILTAYILGLIIVMFSFTVAEMPKFGNIEGPAFNEMYWHYIESAVAETGAVNIVSSVILDYRAFDTLGEATILFVAIAAVIATLRAH